MKKASTGEVRISSALLQQLRKRGLQELFGPVKHRGPVSLRMHRCDAERLEALAKAAAGLRSREAKELASELRKHLRGRKVGHDPQVLDATSLEQGIAGYVAARSERRWVYRVLHGDVLAPYAVLDVEWTVPGISGSIELAYRTPVGQAFENVPFRLASLIGKRVSEILAELGLLPETLELRAAYEQQLEAYERLVLQLGELYQVDGFVSGAFDCELEQLETSEFPLRSDVERVDQLPVVIDKLIETDRLPDSSREWVRLTGDPREDIQDLLSAKCHRSVSFWDSRPVKAGDRSSCDIEIPLHPVASIYDLENRRRRTAHISFLTPTPIDRQKARKIPLVVPAGLDELTEKVLSYDAGMTQDLILGKPGGAIMLFNGPPGVGKTLTAEVCSRRVGRVLYSVQCSELGLDPKMVERRLRVVFSRAERWRAIVLLDEADLYVSKRQRDLHQNALVGSFLRVLEYQDAVLFMTTNTAMEEIDWAVLSRCLVRFNFYAPGLEDRVALWRIFAKNYGVRFEERVLQRLAKDFPDLIGRDIRNVVKLCRIAFPKSQTVSYASVVDLARFRASWSGG